MPGERYTPPAAIAAMNRAGQARADYRAEVARIQRDPDLTREQRREDLAELYARYSRRQAELRGQFNTAFADAQADLGATIIKVPDPNRVKLDSYYGHVARLQDATPDHAALAFQLAIVNGDDLVPRAVAFIAMQKRQDPMSGGPWHALLERFGEVDKAAGVALERFVSIERDWDSKAVIEASAVFSVPGTAEPPDAPPEPLPPGARSPADARRQAAARRIAELFPSEPADAGSNGAGR